MPVNDYRWFRGFNDYDNWQASGVSGEGARSFYYPPKPQKCADCHMPLVASNDPAAKNGMVRSHRFAGGEHRAAVRQRRRGAARRPCRTSCRTAQVSVDIFGLVARRTEATVHRARAAWPPPSRRSSSTFAVGEESVDFGAPQAFARRAAPTVIAPLDKVDARASGRGESVRVEVVVRTRKVGHFFPGGTVDAFDVWVELRGDRRQGPDDLPQRRRRRTAASGPVDPGAHFYRSLLLDEHGNPINKRNAWATRSVAYVRLIPPGAADTIHYRLRDPGGRRRHDHAQGEGQLPQVRLVEHAVGLRGRARSAAGRLRR